MKRLLSSDKFIWIALVFGTILRLISINQSLWLDEATTALVAKMPFADIITKFMPGDFHPPLYYLIMRGWVSTFGASEVSLRIPSVIFGILLVYLVYIISKRLANIKVANIASFLTATSGLLIYYSQEARMYELTALIVALLIYFYIKEKWLLFSAFLTILGVADYVALLILPVFLIFSGKNIKKVLLSVIPLICIFALWMPVFLKQLGGGLGVEGTSWWNTLGALSWKNFGLIPVKFILGRISFDNKLIYGVVAFASLLIYLFAVKKSFNKSSLKIIWIWLVAPILLGVIVSIKIPILSYFRFIYCLPALYILVSYGISSFGTRVARFLLVAVISINIISSGVYLLNPKYHREDWRGIAAQIGDNEVVYPSNSQKEALTYYQKGNQIVYYKDFEGGMEEVWLSRYVWNLFDPNDLARIKIEGLGYNKVTELNLNGVEFWKYSLVKQYARKN